MIVNKIKKLLSGLFIETTLISPYTQDLHTHVILITGGTKGLGKGIAQTLLREGAKVIILARNIKDVDSEFQDKKNISFISVDITSEVQVTNTIKNVIEKFGKIDVLINNVGIFINEKYLEEITESEFDKIITTNIKSMFLVTKSVVPFMKKKKHGLIINIGSKISHNTNVAPKKVLYTTTKYAVEGFSLSLSKEVKQFGIRVTCLMPGTINTFVSVKSKNYMAPMSLGFVVSMIIKSENLDFESIIVKSKQQDI